MGRIIKLMPRFIGDLEYCQNKNWSSRKPQVIERANLMFSRMRNEIGELAVGLEPEHINGNKYKYTFSDGFATIYITAQKDTNNREYLYIDEVIKESVKQVLSELDWKTYANAEKKHYKSLLMLVVPITIRIETVMQNYIQSLEKQDKMLSIRNMLMMKEIMVGLIR